MIDRTLNPIKTGLLTGILILILCAVVPSVRAQNADCTAQLLQAEEHYMYGRFDEAVQSLHYCLEIQGFTKHQQRRVFRLQGLSHLCRDRAEEARTAVENLLKVDPDYKIDPIQDPPMFVTLVEDIREQNAQVRQEAMSMPLQTVGYQAPDMSKVYQQQRSLVMRPYERPVQDMVYDWSVRQERSWIKWALTGAGIVAGSVLTGVLLSTGGNDAGTTATDVTVAANTTNGGNGNNGGNNEGNGGNGGGNRGPGPNPPPPPR